MPALILFSYFCQWNFSHGSSVRLNCRIPPGGGGGACLIGACTSSASIKTRKKGIYFSTLRVNAHIALRISKTGKYGKKGTQIHRSPGQVRGKGRKKSGSDTPVRTRGVVFRELWVPSLHPRLGCFSESD